MNKRNDKSILFICNPKQGIATIRIRGTVFKDSFIDNGWSIDFVSLDNSQDDTIPVFSKNRILEIAQEYQYIYLLKVDDFRFIKEIRNHTDGKLIFDFTDALWRPSFRLTGWKDINKILKFCDFIFSENDFICNYAYKHNKRVINLPAYLPIDLFVERKKEAASVKANTNIVIGWVGSASTVNGFNNIKNVIKFIGKKYDNVEFRILGCSEERFPFVVDKDIKMSFLPTYDENQMVDEVLKMDIGLFHPSLDIVDYKIRGALKGMIYMAAGIPAIFQRAGDCLNFVDDGFNAMLASTEKEWIEKLELLINNKELREIIGDNGFKTVCENHNIKYVFSILEAALLTVGQAFIPNKEKIRSIQGSYTERIGAFFGGWFIVVNLVKSKILRIIKRGT